ncbi:DUF4097 family beta strand repeat-containing protein [Larkinella terrae]|uniref:DUF4097 family beta strand repeat protein n=1 Tax=Larkinella terrae TaxID=2025311 RepID=A0A7K0ERV8_9BACT|nr:hypothetical protein [Larkinella terrae]MRS64276.1 hypothetical protein [Larkinella terrae]
MKRSSFLLTALGALAISFNTLAQDKDETPYETKNFNGSLNNVRVETSGGSISVEGSQSSGVKVEMYVRGNNWPSNKLSKDEIEERLKEYEIKLGVENNTVIATAKRRKNDDWDWKRSINISFKVYTPKNFATDLHTSGGSIRLSNLVGSQNFATSGGSLHLTGVEGLIKGRTSGGSIHLDRCRKDIDLSTSGGSIHAEDSDGNLDLRTSGGSVNLTNLSGKVNARTSGGSVRGDGVKGELVAGTSGGSVRLSGISGSVEASTSGGGMDVEITKLGEYVRLSGGPGSVNVKMPLDQGIDLDLSGNRVDIPLSKFDGTVEKDRVRGRLNGGGVPVRISAGSGSVHVNR